MTATDYIFGKRKSGAALPIPSAEWKYEDTTGTIVTETFGNYHLSVSDASLYTSNGGKVGKAFDYTGKAQTPKTGLGGVSIFEVYDGEKNNLFSVAYWQVNPSGTGASLEFFLQALAGTAKVWLIAIVANNLRAELYLQAGGAIVSQLPSNTTPKFTLSHYIFTFDPADPMICRFYVNGVDVEAAMPTTALTPIKTGITQIQVAGSNSGIMDELKFYKTAVTAEEAMSIYQSEL
jgi:hypothetical protein